MESKKSGRSESYIRRFVDDIKKDKKKTNGRKWSLSMILGYFPWGKTLCYNKMETYLSGREDESPFRNSGDRIS